MENTLLFLCKLTVSSGLLFAFYWIVLRNRASYRLSRLYLLLLPVVSLFMSAMTFGVYHHVDTAFGGTAAAVSTAVTQPDGLSVPAVSGSQFVSPGVAGNSHAADISYGYVLLALWAGVAVLLAGIAIFRIVRLYVMSRRMKASVTADGCRIVRSSVISSPCSFGETIFMPDSLSDTGEKLILQHEMAHVKHRHYVDKCIMELSARILWFDPFIWLARNESGNIHEFEADRDVLDAGAEISAYQTLLLEQVMDGASIYASGFTHSFIRRRFIEMRSSVAGTLGRIGKGATALWVALLFCAFTFTEVQADPANFSDITLAEPQMFTIEGTVAEEITDSCYNIYLSDDYLHINGDKPIATVPVVDKKFRFSIPLDRMKAGRVRCIFPGGELCSAWIDLFFVPGETVRLHVHNGFYRLDPTLSYGSKVGRWATAQRNATDWKAPGQPRLKGKKWDVDTENFRRSPGWTVPYYVKDVTFGKDETVLRIVQDALIANMVIGSGSYLKDDRGRRYNLQRSLFGNLDDNNGPEVKVYGGYYAFDPVPGDVESLSLYNSGRDVPVVSNIKPAAKTAKHKPDFRLDINVSQGIDDSGYLISLIEGPGPEGRIQIADIPVKDKRCSFATYIKEPVMAMVTATFPDGSICSHCMIFPFVPGEHAQLTVKNGVFYLTGSKFYKEWGDADDYFEDVSRHGEKAKVNRLMLDYLKKHADEEGCVIYFLKNRVLPTSVVMDVVPEKIKQGRFMQILKK